MRNDALGKTFAQILLTMKLPVPPHLAVDLGIGISEPLAPVG
ncbi:hypothetical protein [Sphingomonas sp. CL5.1]|nr:hypothetical protein [Sphingomonas sp. CL5.1]